MSLSRRRFLGTAVAGLSATAIGCTGGTVWQTAVLGRVLPAYIDTLLPADEAPGALDLGVHTRIIALIQHKRALMPVYQAGTTWLDAQAMALHDSGFELLPLHARDQLVMRLSEQSGDMLARFFHKSLRHTMMFYYSQPRAWASLGLAAAPQPVGFMDYASAPRKPG